MRVKFLLLVLVVFVNFFMGGESEAFVFISEVLADPPAGVAGDANGDGVTTFSGDEFVELFNDGDVAVDLFGWGIADALRVRHVFESNLILKSQSYLVVFGIDATSGALSLNNGGDSLTLLNANGDLIDSMVYGKEGGRNQSLTRMVDGSVISYQLHATIAEADGRLFSPGTDTDGGIPIVVMLPDEIPTTATPEPKTIALILIGMVLLIIFKNNEVSVENFKGEGIDKGTNYGTL